MDIIGLSAATCVLATFCMQSMVARRGFAIASNLLFIVYGAGAKLLRIVLLHAILLPINGWSLGQLVGGRPAAVTLSLCTAFASCVLTAAVLRAHLPSSISVTTATIRILVTQ
jgi:hypothetical protein